MPQSIREKEKATRINLVIPESMRKELEKLVKKGKYTNLSEVVRDAIRQLLQKYQNQ